MMNIERMRWIKYTMGTCNRMWDADWLTTSTLGIIMMTCALSMS